VTTPELPVVLILDLADENPIADSMVLDFVPAGDRAPAVLHATEFGAKRSRRGTPIDWPSTISAIDQMVSAARRHETAGTPCRYWVAGRAGLPAFVHLGYRLSVKARVTLVNPRDSGATDVLALDGEPPPDTTYFRRSAWPHRPVATRGRAPLIVSCALHSGLEISAHDVEQSLSHGGDAILPAVEAQATTALDTTSVLVAIRELRQATSELRTWYPRCDALAVMIAGPATLAFIVGRMINPHYFPDLQVFQHRHNQYTLAYEIGGRMKSILFLASSPITMTRLALDQEAREIRAEIARAGRRDWFEFHTREAAQPLDILRELRSLKPVVLHFSGHGNSGGLFFQDGNGRPHQIDPAALTDALAAAGSMVKVVVLNACFSAALVAELLTQVGCVIGTTGKIPDDAAKAFAIGFYGALADGDSVPSAFRNGNSAISLLRLNGGPYQIALRDGQDEADFVLAPTQGR
jgi:CHAT domain/SMODS-associated and fused to various effectors sensor domain